MPPFGGADHQSLSSTSKGASYFSTGAPEEFIVGKASRLSPDRVAMVSSLSVSINTKKGGSNFTGVEANKSGKASASESFIMPKTSKWAGSSPQSTNYYNNFSYGGAAAPAGLITGESLEVLAGE